MSKLAVPKGKAPAPKTTTGAAAAAPAPPPGAKKPAGTAASLPAASGGGERAPVRGRGEMEQCFDRLRVLDRLDEAVDAIGPRGLAALCADVGCAFGDFAMYVLVWRLGATQSGCVTRSEWMRAMFAYKVEHLSTVRTLLPQWVAAIRDDESAFTDMYFGLYDFVRGDDEKLLSADKALRAWQVLLPEAERFPLLPLWAQWVVTEYKRPITRDVWRQLWEFARRFGSDLAPYDSNDKWPTALDDFVEWAREKQSAKETAQRDRDAAKVKAAANVSN